MFLDALVNFGANTGTPFSLILAAGLWPLPNVIDLFGNGVGQAPTSIYGRTSNLGPGGDMGITSTRPELFIQIGTAAATATGAQLNMALQAAPDPGSAGNYTPAASAWQTIGESGYMTAAQLTKGLTIFRSPWLPNFPAGLNPRFFRIAAIIGTLASGDTAAVSFTAGSISWAGVTQGRDDYAIGFQPKNYAV